MGLATSRIAFLEKAQESLESVFPGSMTYDGSTFACSRSGLEVVQGAEPGGFENEGRVMVRVRTANLPAAGLAQGNRGHFGFGRVSGRRMFARAWGCGLERGT